LGAPGDKVAWDIYLIYDKEVAWLEHPSAPFDWMHQLTHSSWADQGHYRRGDDLAEALREALHRLLDA
jgi:hypothetical protein